MICNLFAQVINAKMMIQSFSVKFKVVIFSGVPLLMRPALIRFNIDNIFREIKT